MKRAEPSFLVPDWPAPLPVKAAVSLRQGGMSQPPFDSLNVALHVNDNPEVVESNRSALERSVNIKDIVWMNQVHGTSVVKISEKSDIPTADASWTNSFGVACAVMTADCLPVLVCDRGGTKVAAIHAGWRGLCAGIISKAIFEMNILPDDLLIWLGPAIGRKTYQVGGEVRAAFLSASSFKGLDVESAFLPDGASRYLCDLYQLARIELNSLGVTGIYGGDQCTYSQKDSYYSYRRDGATGRMVSLIWLDDAEEA